MANQGNDATQTGRGPADTSGGNDGPLSGEEDFTDASLNTGANDGPISGERDFTDAGQDSVGDISGGGGNRDHITRSYDQDASNTQQLDRSGPAQNQNSGGQGVAIGRQASDAYGSGPQGSSSDSTDTGAAADDATSTDDFDSATPARDADVQRTDVPDPLDSIRTP